MEGQRSSVQRLGKIDAHRAGIAKDLPRGSVFDYSRPERDDVQVLLRRTLDGLVFSILLVYLLIVVNFQSWLDPFLIVAALPAALLRGSCGFLFVTGTHG